VKVSMHQSQYLPWPPYVKKAAAADVFVWMDSVQYQKNGLQNRNQIRDHRQAFWLTIPVTGHLSDLIKDKALVDAHWKSKHWKSLEGSYRKAPRWAEHAPALKALYEAEYRTLDEANRAFFAWMLAAAGVKTKVVRLSELGVQGAKNELILDAMRALGSKTYVSGTGAKDYLDEALFAKAGVAIEYLESVPPAYPQFHGAPIPGLSMMDMLLNAEPAAVAAYLRGNP
jgi:hypothetical protein